MNREEYRLKAKETIDEIFLRIDELEAKKDQADAETQGKINEQITALKAKRQELKDRYDELSRATEDSWEEVKKAFTTTAETFKSHLENIRKNYNL